MSKDIGVVLLPNQECKDFANHMAEVAERELPSFRKLPAIPHITILHIANLDEKGEEAVKDAFAKFCSRYVTANIDLPIKGIKATGGSVEKGYKWLDLQFNVSSELEEIQKAAVEFFCPFHNGILERMNDDKETFTDVQWKELEKCGVTYGKYQPHITAWYINLPNEPKTTKLQETADTLTKDLSNLSCGGDALALVELGRNGNALQVIEEYPLHGVVTNSHNEL